VVGGGRRPYRLLVIAAVVIAVLGVAVVIGVATSDEGQTPPAGVDPVATDPADLIGTWRTVFIKSDIKLNGSRPRATTITFEKDGRWRGSDGCNGIGGTYEADPGEISVKAGPQTEMWCDNVPHVEVLSASVYFRISGPTLTLYDANWNRLAQYSQTQ
jgi:heat shock protein HslJ